MCIRDSPDYDHIIGYRAFKGFKTIASKAFVEKEDKEKVLAEIRKFDDEYYIQRDYAIEYPDIDIVIDTPKKELLIQEDRYEFYYANGHTNDGLLTYNSSNGILVVGDYLSNLEFPFIYDSFFSYRQTLQILQDLLSNKQISMLVTGHGDSTSSLSEMQRRVVTDTHYLKNLEQSIIASTPFDLPTLLSRYSFPKGLEKSHQDNFALVKKELLKS